MFLGLRIVRQQNSLYELKMGRKVLEKQIIFTKPSRLGKFWRQTIHFFSSWMCNSVPQLLKRPIVLPCRLGLATRLHL